MLRSSFGKLFGGSFQMSFRAHSMNYLCSYLTIEYKCYINDYICSILIHPLDIWYIYIYICIQFQIGLIYTYISICIQFPIGLFICEIHHVSIKTSRKNPRIRRAARVVVLPRNDPWRDRSQDAAQLFREVFRGLFPDVFQSSFNKLFV